MDFKKVTISSICVPVCIFMSASSLYADEVIPYNVYQDVNDSMELMEYITNSKINLSISTKRVANILCNVSGNT